MHGSYITVLHSKHGSTSTLPLTPHYPLPLLNTPFLLTWRTSFSCSWCEYPSTLVPGLLPTVLPLLLHPPRHTPQIKLQYLHRRHQQHQLSCLIQVLLNIFIDHGERLLVESFPHKMSYTTASGLFVLGGGGSAKVIGARPSCRES
jgi:hypothetical protein